MAEASAGRDSGYYMSKGTERGVSIVTNEEPAFSKGSEERILKVSQENDQLRDTVSSLYQMKKLSDFVIRCSGGRTINAHRLVLVSYSSFFNELLLKSPGSEDCHSIEVEGDYDLVEPCLQFMYTGETKVTEDHLKALLGFAEKLGISSLEHCCLSEIYKDYHATRENCFELWEIGLRIKLPRMVDDAVRVALKDFSQLQHEVTFKALSWRCIAEYLSDKHLKVQSPEERLMAGLVWIKADEASRTSHLPNLLSILPLTSMSDWCLRHMLHHEEVFSSSEEAKRIINEAINMPKLSLTQQQDATVPENKSDTQTSLALIGVRVLTRAENEDQRIWRNAREEISLLPLTSHSPPSTLASLPASIPQDGLIACCTNGIKIFVAGIGTARSEVWAFHLKNQAWENVGNLSYRRLGHCMAVCKDKIYVLGGRKPGRLDLISRVEKVDRKKSQAVGQLVGTGCTNCCSVVHNEDIIIYGAQDDKERSLLQVFSTKSYTVSHFVVMPSLGCAVYGLAITNSHIITCDYNGTNVCSIDSLYDSTDNLADIVTSSSYKSPKTWCCMFMDDKSGSLVLVGGERRETPNDGNMFRAKVSDVIRGSGPGWTAVEEASGLGVTVVAPAAAVLLDTTSRK